VVPFITSGRRRTPQTGQAANRMVSLGTTPSGPPGRRIVIIDE